MTVSACSAMRVANLTAIVADAALRVRMNLAQTVKNLPDAPRDIVLRLAHDPVVMICEPVIRFSPMLTQEDLVMLIATTPPPTTLLAIASRPKIGETVSDAIVGTADSEAICALLANPTAQIRETTLDFAGRPVRGADRLAGAAGPPAASVAPRAAAAVRNR